jgi:hypothetical protein
MENRPDTNKSAADEVRQQAREQAEKYAEEGKERAESLKSRLGEEAGRTASALGSAAGEFDAEGQQRVAELLADFSRNLGDFARQVQHKSLDELLQDGSRLARSNPVLFLAGSVAAGAVLSRFFKAHAPPGGSRTVHHGSRMQTDHPGPRTQVDARAGVHSGSPSAAAGTVSDATTQAEATKRSPGGER